MRRDARARFLRTVRGIRGGSFSVAVAATLVATSAARAQSVARMVGYDVQHAAGDVIGTWIAPARSTGENWLIAGGVVAGAAALSPFDDRIDNWFLHNRDEPFFSAIRPFREGGAAFAGRTVTPIALALYVTALATNNRSLRDGVLGCAASWAAESAIRTEVIYRVVSRLRPDSLRTEHVTMESVEGDQYQFSVPAEEPWGTHSLPAGHMANLMACASFLTYRYHVASVTLPAYTLATFVGLGRLADRRHWASDTVLGAIFGFAIGKEIGLRSRDRFDHDVLGHPLAGTSRVPILVSWQMQF